MKRKPLIMTACTGQSIRACQSPYRRAVIVAVVKLSLFHHPWRGNKSPPSSPLHIGEQKVTTMATSAGADNLMATPDGTASDKRVRLFSCVEKRQNT